MTLRFKLVSSLVPVLAVFALTTPAYADVEGEVTLSERDIDLGVHLGMSVSGANVSNAYPVSQKVGFAGGLLLNAEIVPDIVSLQPELNFVQRGAKLTRNGVQGTTNLSYLDFPLLFKAKLVLGGVAPFVMAGPKLGVLLYSSSMGYEADTVSEAFSTLDLGFAVGGGLAFPFTKDNEFYIMARYERGLVDIDTSSDMWKTEEVKVLAGVMF